MRDAVVELPSGRYSVVDFGGSGPDVLLVHDLLMTSEIWRPFAEELSGFCHAVAVDLCGHGRTEVREETAETLVGDLPHLVDALGLDRPLVVVGQEELLSLFDRQLREIGARAVLVALAVSPDRGEAAEQRWQDLMGPEALEGWVERARLFASGPTGTRTEFIEERVAHAGKDWVNQGVAEDQLRGYFERQIRTTPEGWERVPTRTLHTDVLRRVAQGPFGLDALDLPDVPVWAMVSAEVTDDAELDRFTQWAAEKPGRRVRTVEGSIAIDSVDPALFGLMVRELLELTV